MNKEQLLERMYSGAQKTEIEAYYRGVQDTIKEIALRYKESPDAVPNVQQILEEVLDEMIGGI